jgi:hypothetical protein
MLDHSSAMVVAEAEAEAKVTGVDGAHPPEVKDRDDDLSSSDDE